MFDLFFFSAILISVAVGWLFGYFRGVINGAEYVQNTGLDEYPISNVKFVEIENKKYTFYDMVTDRYILTGTFEECISSIKKDNPEKKIVFSKGDK